MRTLSVRAEAWPLHQPFRISRQVFDKADVVVAEIAEAGITGRGEAERTDAYDADVTAIADQIEAVRPDIEAGADRALLQQVLPRGPARNALDCALWDLEAKRTGRPVWQLAGLEAPLAPVTTVFTISIDSPEKMAADAAAAADRPVLKLKLGREGDPDRVAAVRAVAPLARISADANTGWSEDQLRAYMPELARHGVELVEQPFKPGADAMLTDYEPPIPLAADESCLDRHSLADLAGKYGFVNIKLDKTGGLTEALALAREAQAMGFGVMVGCNLGTSLAMAPGLVVAQLAVFVDLDGPLLLSRDRAPGLCYEGGTIHPPDPRLWG